MKILDRFREIKAAMGDVGATKKSLRSDLEKKRQKREYFLFSPICKEDFLELASKDIDAAASQYTKKLGLQLDGTTFQKSPLQLSNSGFSLLSPWSSANNTYATSNGVLALMAPIIKEQLAKIVGEMEWPESGPPLAEREKAIAQLDKEIEQIETKLQELNEAAEAAGIRLD